jgi:uncharacterized membrane protein YfcA/uncharacterized membrane protein YedE/YeeE
MIVLGLVLSMLMGGVLGLLGGGGSILAVPILVYVFGLDAKPALATSLLVVAISSAIGALQHARAGNVRPRTAALFGTVAMLGAYGGARCAAFLPDTLLLLLFGVMLTVTGVMMLRQSRGRAGPALQERESFPRIAVEGLGVGVFTGLVGAGGGFLVVPVLTTLGGLPIHAALGTALLVIALNATAGFIGYLAHVTVDLRIAALVTAAAVVGALLGGRLAGAVSPAVLRRAFGFLVLAMAGFVLCKEAPMWLLTHPLVAGPLLGGALIGLAAAGLLLFNGRIAGISGIVGGLLHPTRDEVGWRTAFVGGLLAGGALFAATSPELVGPPVSQSGAVLALAGGLVGIGTRLGGGCTSGHGVCGVSRGSVRSVVATVTFMASAAAVVFVTRHVVGRLS